MPFYIFGSFVLLCLPISWYFVEPIKDDDEVLNESTSVNNHIESDGGSLPENKMTFFKLLFKLDVVVNSLILVSISSANSFLFPTLEEHLKLGLNITDMKIVSLQFFIASGVYVVSTLIIGRYLGDIKYQFGVMLAGVCLTIMSLLIIGPSELLVFLKPGLTNTSIGMVLLGLGCAFGFIPSFECYYRSCIKYGLENSIETYGAVAGLWSMMFSVG